MGCCSNPLCECPPDNCHCTPDRCVCDMRGLLQFTLLWELSLADGVKGESGVHNDAQGGEAGRTGEPGDTGAGGGKGGPGGLTGQQLAARVERRRGYHPSPGTLYPALKTLAGKGLVNPTREGRTVRYVLTASGREGLATMVQYFIQSFGDILGHELTATA